MNLAGGTTTTAVPKSVWSDVTARLGRFYPRWQSRQFWAVQVLVVVIAFGHMAFEALDNGSDGTWKALELSFVPTAFFFIPAIYAALNFGTVGAVATAAWCVALSLPNMVLFRSDRDWVADVVQLTAVTATTFFVGQRTDREVAARRRAETAVEALKASELKYRRLFKSSPSPILILNSKGLVIEANPAAGALLGRPHESLAGQKVSSLIGAAGSNAVLGPPKGATIENVSFTLVAGDRTERFLQPSVTNLVGPDGDSAIQLLLRDLTAERLRQAGLRAYAASVVRVQEAERQRIARDLHDQTVQELVLLCRQLDLAESATGGSAEVVAELSEARLTAEKVASDLRDFARSLRPPTLDDLGLATAIRGLLADVSERANITGQFSITGGERRLETDAELTIFRIAQEALRNVEHHARAEHVNVTIRFSDHQVEVDIVDDGTGFVTTPTTDFAATGHLGLLGMRERAETLGGKLEIVSSPSVGTRVSVWLDERYEDSVINAR